MASPAPPSPTDQRALPAATRQAIVDCTADYSLVRRARRHRRGDLRSPPSQRVIDPGAARR
jgi:hypothetical protein